MQSLSYLVFFIVFLSVQSKQSVDEQHCEGKNISFLFNFLFYFSIVCIKTISTFADTLTNEDKSNVDNIEKAFKKYCSKVKVDSKEHRLVNTKILVQFEITKI
jgi:hypothetical protein